MKGASKSTCDRTVDHLLTLFGGIGLPIVLHMSANIAYHAMRPMEQTTAVGDHAAEVMVASLLGSTGSMTLS